MSAILNGPSLMTGGVCINYKTSNPKTYRSAFASISRAPAKVSFSSIRSSWGPHQKLNCTSSQGIPIMRLSAASSPHVCGDLGGLSHTVPQLHRPRRQTYVSPIAAKDVPFSIRYPVMTEKPRWWWRTCACLPYLVPLHQTWIFAETASNLHPLLENMETLTHPFWAAYERLPSWFSMACTFVLFLGVVRRKEWPHFLRFHVVMGILLETALMVMGTVSKWLPLFVYWSKIGMCSWTAIGFVYLITVFQCMRCALAGRYADIPFMSDAAYIQVPCD